MQLMRAQGATQLRSGATYCPMLGQGATEYLVLLAVVLIVALVSVALLGFFPGMASDAQATQSKTYWASAQPIAIIEMGAISTGWNGASAPYLRLRNSGSYSIRITGVLAGNGKRISQYYYNGGSAVGNMSDVFYMAPGEEKYFGLSTFGLPGGTSDRMILFTLAGGVYAEGYISDATSLCTPTAPFGTLVMPNFGFEYIEYIDGQQITKRQIGKPLIIKCTG